MTDFAPVKDVYNYTVGSVEGIYAEYAVVLAKFLSKKPVSMNYIEAAGIPCIGLTAYQTLVDGLNVQAGETVAITGATGGVDTIAVQNAISLGACVVGTASGTSAGYVRQLGTGNVIDYKQGDWIKAVRGLYPADVDVLFTSVAGETKQQSPGAVRDGGGWHGSAVKRNLARLWNVSFKAFTVLALRAPTRLPRSRNLLMQAN